MPAYIVGIDEAGYGPNLGPLVICSTLWEVTTDFVVDQFWEMLAPAVTQGKPFHESQIQVADSKVVYQSTTGLKNLETSVITLWSALANNDVANIPYTAFKSSLTGKDSNAGYLLRQHQGLKLPVETSLVELSQHKTVIKELFTFNKITLISVQALVVQPAEFNQSLVTYGNKGQLLSQLSLQLIRSIITQYLSSDKEFGISIYADKQGGRKSYAGLIAEHFPQHMPRVIQEEQICSRYVAGNISWQFSVGSERFFPVAVASMFAKYLRELEMMMFNNCWAEQIPGIKPTAGYPVDAKRFFELIEHKLQNLSLSKLDVWRNK